MAKKTSTQLDREIDEALSKRANKASIATAEDRPREAVLKLVK